jgi:hypothetical protein
MAEQDLGAAQRRLSNVGHWVEGALFLVLGVPKRMATTMRRTSRRDSTSSRRHAWPTGTRLVHDGTALYFCSQSCADRFVEILKITCHACNLIGHEVRGLRSRLPREPTSGPTDPPSPQMRSPITAACALQ